MKTLDQVEPRIPISAEISAGDNDSLFKITQPGSYHLTGNRLGVAGKHGIKITSPNVTLDLMGYSLRGRTIVGELSLSGVDIPISASNICVKNGVITG